MRRADVPGLDKGHLPLTSQVLAGRTNDGCPAGGTGHRPASDCPLHRCRRMLMRRSPTRTDEHEDSQDDGDRLTSGNQPSVPGGSYHGCVWPPRIDDRQQSYMTRQVRSSGLRVGDLCQHARPSR